MKIDRHNRLRRLASQTAYIHFTLHNYIVQLRGVFNGIVMSVRLSICDNHGVCTEDCTKRVKAFRKSRLHMTLINHLTTVVAQP